MKLTELKPMIWTEDLDATVEFYTKTLGFECDNIVAELGWASLSKDSVSLMLRRPDANTEYDKPIFTGSFYFSTDDVDGMWQLLKDKAPVCYGIENFNYGMREFAIYDNNGYLLQFGQPVDKL
jgi:catechol 2,3-dioxygenase-like lactoylglutathione lyase family enzyme